MKRYLFVQTHDGGEMEELPDGELTPFGDGEYSRLISDDGVISRSRAVLTADVYLRYIDLLKPVK